MSSETSSSPARSWRDSTLWSDAKSAGVACIIGLALMVLVDFVATIWVAPAPLRLTTILRLLPLEVTLAAIWLPLALPMTIGAAWVFRWTNGEGKPGLFAPFARHDEMSNSAATIWAVVVTSFCFLAISTVITLKLGSLFREPQLTALVIAFTLLVVIYLLFAVAALIRKLIFFLGQKIHGKLGVFSPFGSPPAACIALILIAWPIVRVVLAKMPQLSPFVPWRNLLAIASYALGCYAATHLLAWRGSLWPTQPKKRKIAIGSAALAAVVIAPLTLLHFGADPDTKALAISSSPTMASSMNILRRGTDFDGDGFGSLLGENDCAPFNSKIHPLARDIPDNDIDENCDGRDFRLGVLPSYKTGEVMPVPDAYLEDWNVLFLTVDTVRYDHTSFGGYKRDTTPNLKKFAERSANFTFANAPSAGTMASIPSILASKFFHSGIALDENIPRGSPPKLLDSNTLMPELFKAKGYGTGAILSHEYFNDWGMNQGVDDYDNTVGKKRDPFGVTSKKLSDRAISWIGKQRKKWFLWVHFIDPHGRYVSHPGETSYGDTEEDLYDGELHFTDKHMGDLLDYVARSQGGKKTIIIITSDHGDAFGEHGYINHAQDLHRELLHVPLIFYVPNIEPRNIPGAVSPIDIFPTLADLIGYDIRSLNVEGESLVPQLFYGKDAEHRVVFSETNYPKPLRAAVNSRYKLILDLKNNVSRLFDLKKDPLEKKNVWTSDKEGYKEMRGYLSEWIERVVYSRDSESNQAIAKLADHLVRERPTAASPIEEVSLDRQTFSVDSFEIEDKPHKPGDKLSIALYFRANKTSDLDLKFQMEAWIETPINKRSRSAKSPLRLTGKGMFPTSRWHEGELVRDRFSITLPKDWKSESDKSVIKFGIRAKIKKRKQGSLEFTGPLRPSTTDMIVLGSFSLTNPAPIPPPPEPGPSPTKPVVPGQPTLNPSKIPPNLRQHKIAPVGTKAKPVLKAKPAPKTKPAP